MNNEINTMIELQHYWNIVMQKENEIERHKKSIQIWEKRLSELKETFLKKETLLKNLKLRSKQSELELDEIIVKILKIEQRKDNIKSERELEAQNNELKQLQDHRDSLETSVLSLMEQIESSESEIEKLRIELEETDTRTKTDISSIRNKITESENEAGQNRSKYDNLLNNLSPSSKTRFAKLISSKDGIAIAQLNGETCSHCNFQIPSAIAVSASKRESLNTCTNCGRFIY